MVSWLMKCKVVKFRKFYQPEIPLDTFIPIRQYMYWFEFSNNDSKKKKRKVLTTLKEPHYFISNIISFSYYPLSILQSTWLIFYVVTNWWPLDTHICHLRLGGGGVLRATIVLKELPNHACLLTFCHHF